MPRCTLALCRAVVVVDRRRAPAAASARSRRCRGRPAAGRRGPAARAPGSPCGPSRRRGVLDNMVGHAVALAREEPLVALGLEAVGQLRAALLDDPAVDEDVDEVGLDVAQDARVVRDEQHAGLAALAYPVDALGHDLQRVDVEARVGLVEDRDLRLEQLELQDLVALLLATGEALVDAALGERRVDGEPLHGLLDVLDPGAQLRSLAVDRRSWRVRRKLDTETPGTSTGYCIARNSPARARSSTVIASTSAPSRVTVPPVTVYFGWPAME